MGINVFDCEDIEGSMVLKKELLHVVRSLFTDRRETEFRDWDSSCDDECLFAYSRAKYYPNEDEETARERAAVEFWRWRHKGGKVPLHLCSYFNHALKERNLLVA